MKFIISLSLLFSAICLISCSDNDAGDPKIEPSRTSVNVGAAAVTEKITLKSNYDWETDVSEKWVTVAPVSGKAGETEISIVFTENLSGKKRTASLSFLAGGKETKIPLEQDIQQVLTLPVKNFTADTDGCIVSIVSDQEYQATIPADVYWISFKETNGVLRMTVSRNTTDKDRLCKVVFKNAATGGILETLVIQRGTASSSDILTLKSMKIDNIPCVVDQGDFQAYFPVDMELPTPVLTHKIEFEGLGIEYLKIKGTDKKIYSGETVSFDEFEARTRIIFSAGNNLIDNEKNAILNITGLPIVSIFAPEGIVDEPKKPCDMIFIDPKGRTNYGKQKNLKYFEAYAGIEWRGSGALRYVKKAYGFKLRDKATEESVDAELLGLRDDNNWILDAMWLDKARMRNRVLFDVWNEFNELYYKKTGQEAKANSGTHGHLVEVFLDGKYHGMYVLSDKLDRKQLKLKKEGGYLYKVTGWSDECLLRAINSPYNNNSLVWNEVEMDYPDEIGKVEFKYYDNLIRFITETSAEEFSARFEEVIDINNMVDHFIYTNLFFGYDNIGRNTFWGIYNVNESTKMIPLIWDLDGTLGRTWDRHEENPNDGFLIYNRHNGKSYRIYKRIMNDNPADIKSKIKARWAEIKNGAVSPDNMNSKLDYYGNQQVNSGASEREISRWRYSAEYDYSDVMGEVTYIKNWYAKRWAKMDQLITGGELDKTGW